MEEENIADAHELLPIEQRTFENFYKLKRHKLENFDSLFYDNLPAMYWKQYYESLLRSLHNSTFRLDKFIDAKKIILFCVYITERRILFSRCEEKALNLFKIEWYLRFKEELDGDVLKWHNDYVRQYAMYNYASSGRLTSNRRAYERLANYFIERGMAVLSNQQGYELVQEVWYELFDCEELNLEQAKFRLEMIRHSDAVHQVNPLTLQNKIDRFIKHCELNHVFIESGDAGLDTIKSLWKKLYGVDLTATQSKERLKSIKKQARYLLTASDKVNQNSKIKQYCSEHNIMIESNIEGFKKFKNIWEQLFNTKLTNKQAKERKKRFIAYAPELYEHTEPLKQLRLSFFIEHCHKNGIVLSNGDSGKDHLKNLWKELFAEQLSDGQVKERFRYLSTANSEIVLKPVKKMKMTSGTVSHYKKVVEYCADHNIVIAIGIQGIEKIQEIWIKLFDKTLTLKQAKERRKTLKNHAQNLFEDKKPSVKKRQIIVKNKVELEDVYSLDEKSREELLITFCEYCESQSLSFMYNESDEVSLKQAWRECFGIK